MTSPRGAGGKGHAWRFRMPRPWVVEIVGAVVAMALGGYPAIPLGYAAEPPGEPVLRIEAEMHAAPIARIATDGTSRYLVTGSGDKTVRVWDLGSGQLLRVLRPPIGIGHEGKIGGVAMSPDGATIACGGWTGYEWDNDYSIYVFDRATGRLIKRVARIPASIYMLAWSPDGKFLAAALKEKGIRVFRVRDWSQVGADTSYRDSSFSVDFHDDKLVSTSWDGMIRLYRVTETEFSSTAKEVAPGGKQPYAARFSPDGSRIAVGYYDGARIDVLSGRDLAHMYSPDTPHGMSTTATPADLALVAWSKDGQRLWAAGFRPSSWAGSWTQAGRGSATGLSIAEVADIAALGTERLVFTNSMTFGIVDAAGNIVQERRPVFGDFRGNDGAYFRLSKDATVVQFSADFPNRSRITFDLRNRRVVFPSDADAQLVEPVTTAPGLDIRNWYVTKRPTLNSPGLLGFLKSRVLRLDHNETSLSIAIAPDRKSFVLGSSFSVRRFDTDGRELWRVTPPGLGWGVNVSGDGKVVVAAVGDGTLRWYRLSDGKELLGLFVHADRQRWLLWSPSGYYDASTGAEDLIGWHVNRGKDVAADFYPVSRFRGTFYRPDVVARILETADEATALRLADADAGRKTQAVEIAKVLPPVVEILAPASGAAVSTPEVRVQFSVRTAADAPVIRLRARVNGQTVSLAEARDITAAAKPGAVRELSIPIPPNDSDILLFAENRHGVSVPAVLNVSWHGASPKAFVIKPKLYVLAIGVSDYQVSAFRLYYAAKDARDFAGAMLAQNGGLYRDVELRLLTDAQATREEIVDGLDWLQRQVTAKDIGMLFLAGHGVNDPNGIYYYLPVNADVDKLKRTAVPFSDIRNTLSALSGKALFLIDTCYSGNVMGGRRSGPPDITAMVNDLASAENGVVVFASSTGRQYSLESQEWKNGAFTKALVEGVSGKADLRQTGEITHKMLDAYVADRVKELTRGRQTPVNVSPQGVPDFPIALANQRH